MPDSNAAFERETPDPEHNFFSRPSTRWDILKFLAPVIAAIAITFTTMFFTQQSQAQALGEHKVTIERIETSRAAAREDVFKRLAVLEEIAKRQADDVKEIRADVKTLILRGK
jgi:hypothetical protein